MIEGRFTRTQVMSTGMSWPRRTGALCGTLGIALGLVVLLGWAVRSPLLIQVEPNLPPMQRNAAVGFVLSGLALLGIVMNRPRLTLMASVVALLGAASLLEHLFQVNFGIDELLGAGYITTHTSSPGRMAPATAFCSSCWPSAFCWRKPAASSTDLRRSELQAWWSPPSGRPAASA